LFNAASTTLEFVSLSWVTREDDINFSALDRRNEKSCVPVFYEAVPVGGAVIVL
jgi:hypothetical protein